MKATESNLIYVRVNVEFFINKDDSLLKALFMRNRGEKRAISVKVSPDAFDKTGCKNFKAIIQTFYNDSGLRLAKISGDQSLLC